jgi:hypothetical protein
MTEPGSHDSVNSRQDRLGRYQRIRTGEFKMGANMIAEKVDLVHCLVGAACL